MGCTCCSRPHPPLYAMSCSSPRAMNRRELLRTLGAVAVVAGKIVTGTLAVGEVFLVVEVDADFFLCLAKCVFDARRCSVRPIGASSFVGDDCSCRSSWGFKRSYAALKRRLERQCGRWSPTLSRYQNVMHEHVLRLWTGGRCYVAWALWVHESWNGHVSQCIERTGAGTLLKDTRSHTSRRFPRSAKSAEPRRWTVTAFEDHSNILALPPRTWRHEHNCSAP
ncbi:hypothetical protein BD310DRAFT_306516 [Dichomitus squalens]|uniref:Uncharacterized protein n=1 Tax=Dichomitus squalens TaxID=114155 RepID=A0A4Q9QBV4_9APHY|nr:hypothetical protein BD310DRAFT_306516 [Dichomitus squalens]